jgi:hypothetical protein
MADILERPLNPRVAPARIVGGHPDGETTDFRLHAGSPRTRPHVRPLPANQLAVPAQDCVRRHDRRHVREDPSAETLTDDGEPATFVIVQPDAPAVQLRLQYAVLFPQEFQ